MVKTTIIMVLLIATACCTAQNKKEFNTEIEECTVLQDDGTCVYHSRPEGPLK